MARPRRIPAAVAAPVVDGPDLVEGVWPEVFTGLANPDRVHRGEEVALPDDVAEALLAVGAVKRA